MLADHVAAAERPQAGRPGDRWRLERQLKQSRASKHDRESFVGETTGIAAETAERHAADSLHGLARLTSFVKAYDVRGLVGSQLTSDVSRALGYAFARFVAAQSSAVVIAYDMRESSPELAGAYAEGVTSAGLDVVMAGLGSTDLLYFASGRLNLPGAMFTASHNPARYNGIKMCLAGAVPISLETGLAQVRDEAQALLDGAPAVVAERRGTVTEQNLLADYADYLRTLVDLSDIRPLHVVVDAGNGMAFDGDADRCFVIDEKGDPVSPSAVTALVASRELRRHPGATILYNLISSRAVPEIVREAGGVPIRTRVGHSFIKAEMAATNAVFGDEHSAHYYFADFIRADTGMLAAMHVMAELGGQGRPLSEFAAEFARYADSGEINSTVADAK